MRVLLVEDDSATAQGIEMMLRSEGYVCDATDMGEDGLEIGKLYDYDIIVLDLMLPDIDGYEVLRRLRAARVQTPILILSGLNGLDDKIKGLGVGADDYLTKPFDKRELIARIQAIVRGITYIALGKPITSQETARPPRAETVQRPPMLKEFSRPATSTKSPSTPTTRPKTEKSASCSISSCKENGLRDTAHPQRLEHFQIDWCRFAIQPA